MNDQDLLLLLLSKLEHVEAQVNDMQPRVEMLNHWHCDVNDELADHRARLRNVEHTSRISAATGVVNVAFNVVKGLFLGG